MNLYNILLICVLHLRAKRHFSGVAFFKSDIKPYILNISYKTATDHSILKDSWLVGSGVSACYVLLRTITSNLGSIQVFYHSHLNTIDVKAHGCSVFQK